MCYNCTSETVNKLPPSVAVFCTLLNGRKHEKERIRKLGIVLPYTLHAILLLKTTNPRQLEREIHELFEEKRVRGEWFKLDKQDIEYFVEDWHSPVWNIGACYHA